MIERIPVTPRTDPREGLASSANWRGELAGGATSAAVGVTLALSTGLIAFAPLGPAFAAIGVEAARWRTRSMTSSYDVASARGTTSSDSPRP